MALTAEQRANVRRVIAAAKRRNASPRELKAVVEAAGVESNYRHLTGGDRDSTGILQQRPSMGWGPIGESIDTDVGQFLQHAKRINRGGFSGSAGQLAQAVQRSAFPARYDQRSGEAESLLRKFGASPRATASPGGSQGSPGRVVANTTTTPGVDNSALRQQLRLDYLDKRGKDPGALLGLITGIGQARDTAPTTKTTYSIQGGTQQGNAQPSVDGENPIVARAQRRAEKIDAAKKPYLWGGGHAGKVSLKGGVAPLDCSGAVSAVLGIDPRVASQFKSFGSPGRAPGGRGISIYAADDHVLMEIDGKLFGTSGSNPGGGAGWIKRSDLPKGYLNRFTVRHLSRSAR